MPSLTNRRAWQHAGILVALACLCAPIIFGCGGDQGGSAAPASLMLLAAASTTDAVEEIAGSFTKETGIPVQVSIGPSNGLAQQVIAGAPADVFVSASQKWADALRQAELTREIRPLLANRLVLIVPAGNPGGVKSPDDLLSDRVQRIALTGENTPAGTYSDAALRSLGLLEQLQAAGKIARGHDVRATLGYVEQGEAEAGMVYATDARVSQSIEVVTEIDPRHYPAIVYPAVLLKKESAIPQARQLFDYLSTPQAAAIFRRHGFTPLEGTAPIDASPARQDSQP